MLSCDLEVKHVLALFLLVLELFEHDLSVVLLGLKLVLKLDLHLSLSFEVLGFLVSISDALALDLVLKLHVLFVHTALLCQDLLDASVADVFLRFELNDALLGDGNVDLHLAVLIGGLHGLVLGLFGEVLVITLANLLVLLKKVVEDLSIEVIN